MFTLTNFAFVINRHPLTPLGDENGQKKPLFGPPHGFMVAEGNKIHKKKGRAECKEFRNDPLDGHPSW